MNEWITSRLAVLKEDLLKKQEHFKINIRNIDSPTYEANTIKELMETKQLNTAMDEPDLMLQLNGIFTQENK